MSALLNYLNEHEDWEQLITQPPYNIKVSTDGIYRLLKYNQTESDFNEPIVCECRGCIVKQDAESGRWMFVCEALIKFFNYGEPYAAELDWKSASVQAKIDGSLIKVWYDDAWHISTNGTIDAFQALTGNTLYPTYGALVLEALEQYFTDYHEEFFGRLDKNCTYWFELVSPYNQVVIHYDEIKLFFLGWRDMRDGKELDSMDCVLRKYFPMPLRYKLSSLKEVVATAEVLGEDEEGFVVVDKNFNRIKVKSPLYVKRHYLATQNVINDERLIDIILQKEQDEFLTYCPAYRERVKEIEQLFVKVATEAMTSLDTAVMSWVVNDTDSRKHFAAIVKATISPKYQPFCFYWLKLYETNTKGGWCDFTKDWSAAKWKKFLDL